MFKLMIGIFIGTKILKEISSLLFDDLILEEKEKRKDKIKTYNNTVKEIKREAIKNQKAASKRKDNLREQYKGELDSKIKIYNKKALRQQEELYYYMIETVKDLEAKMKNIDDELGKQIKEVIKKHENSQLTSIRARALNIIRKELIKNKEKNTAYIHYLQNYLYLVKQRYRNEELLPEYFKYSLPDDYPFKGKVYYKKKNELSPYMNWQVCKKTNLKNKFHLRDFENLKYFNSEDAEIPLFIEYYDSRAGHHSLSIAKGLFMDNAIKKPGESLTSSVKEIKKNELVLDYYGFDLILKRSKLINSRRTPPLNSTVSVYPYSWNYHLTKKPYMSERKELGFNQENFGSIPLIISKEDFNSLKNALSEHDLWSTKFEWKIAPDDNSKLKNFNKLKCSLGGLTFLVNVVQEERKVFLEFDEILADEEDIKKDDIFVVVNATFELAFNSDKNLFDQNNFEKLSYLIIFLSQRFEEQKDIIDSRSGINYFKKWTDLTDELVEEGFKGESFYCEFKNLEIKSLDKKSSYFFSVANIVNREELSKKLAELRNQSNYKSNFFTFSSNGERIIVEFGLEANAIMFYHEEPKLPFKNNVALIYKEEFPYPEIQQKIALNNFREGIIVNNKLKINLLNPKTISKEELSRRFSESINQLIPKNISQYNAVRNSFQDKNIFMIQGPPGTGKTTVIKELILQELKDSPDHKILVTSQANVAVDNVITKLFDNNEHKKYLSKDSVIRYGNQKKINDQIMFTAYEKKEQNYSKVIDEKTKDSDDFLVEKWNSYINKKDDPNFNIGELFLKNHQVIAATCVGLAQRKAGLDKIDFDLVIIDEAGKALAGELIIPILRAKKVIIIGDHKQLPPIVNPNIKEDLKIENRYEEILKRSIFERLFDQSKENKEMLNTQYRMPAIVGDLISQEFYSTNLKNGSNTFDKSPVFSNNNLNMINMDGVRGYCNNNEDGQSPYNLKEVEVIVNLLNKINKNIDNKIDIALITPYLGQKNKLIGAIENKDYGRLNIDINTVDAFQGNEADLVIFATTRSKRTTPFFRDNARLNVALSRVVRELWIIGSLKYFKSFSKNTAIFNIGRYLEKNASIIQMNN